MIENKKNKRDYSVVTSSDFGAARKVRANVFVLCSACYIEVNKVGILHWLKSEIENRRKHVKINIKRHSTITT